MNRVLYVATMAFYAVRQAVVVSGAVGLTAAVLAPVVMKAFGAGPGVAAEGVLFLRCVGPYLVLMGCCIALGGVFEGSGRASALLRVTVLGTAVQLPLAHGLSGFGLPGICLALAVSMAAQCVVLGPSLSRGPAQEPSGSLARVG